MSAASVDVDDEPRAFEPLRVGSGERRLGEAEQRLHAKRARLGRERVGRVSLGGHVCVARGGSLLAPALEHSVTRSVQRLDEQRAVLGSEAGAQVQGAVLLEVIVDVLQLVGLPRFLGRDPPVHAQRTLELGRRQRARELEQPLLGRRGRDPRQRAHLREGELAARERRPCRGQLSQRLGNPHVLARLAPGDPAAVREEACEIVADLRLVELPHALDEAGGRGAQVRGERRQLIHAAPLLPPALLGVLQPHLKSCCLHCQPD